MSPKVSVSLINGKVYQIPSAIDDRKIIDQYRSLHKGKKIVVVQGLGFVGSVMSLIVSNALTEDYLVIGVDLPTPEAYWKICSINEGIFPVVASDKKIDNFFKKARRNRNFLATSDPYAYSVADVIIVDINLDVKKANDKTGQLNGYHVDLGNFRKAIETISLHCKENVLLLLESTVPPGTCQQVVKPIMDKKILERGLKNKYKLGHSYERVMPGPGYIDSIQNFYRVYSGVDQPSATATEKFLRTVISTKKYPLTQLSSTTASEMAKVLENSFRAMNIAFIEEWVKFAERASVNLFEVVEAIRMRPTHRNIMMPGLGVGGYCLPKDPLLASWAAQNFFGSSALEQSEKAVMINDTMPHHSFLTIRKWMGDLRGKKILMLGVSYLSNVGDTRYSPSGLVYDHLLNEGAEIILHDPYITFWEEKKTKVNPMIDHVLNQPYDAVIFCTGHDEYKESKKLNTFIEKLKCWVFDTNRVLSDRQITRYRKSGRVKIIGRGDI